MPKFKLTIAYDGTDFVGWQRQASGVSIQGLLEHALEELDGAPVSVTGAGRTDAGVHALGQTASCVVRRIIAPDVLTRAINARLPPEVRVMDAAEADPAFHARFDAQAKTYRYRIWNGDVISPFERRYAWHVADRLDLAAMCTAARSLEGRHDFASFQSAGSTVRSSERTLMRSRFLTGCTVTEHTDANGGSESRLLCYEVIGDGFLRHMVRAIVGTLVEIGRGRWPADRIVQLVASRDRAEAGPTAPAAGLFLVDVRYGAL
jgi:tRNA pseudouridine38-40 synthase